MACVGLCPKSCSRLVVCSSCAARLILTPNSQVKTGDRPIPGRKRIDAIQGVLPARDQHKADTAGGLISMDQWGEMVMKGDPLA